MAHARTGLVDLEDLSEEELDRLQEEFKKVRQKAGVAEQTEEV